MSANNLIVIFKKEGKWLAEERDADMGGKISTVVEGVATLEDAIRASEEYMKEEEVEYGYRVVLPK